MGTQDKLTGEGGNRPNGPRPRGVPLLGLLAAVSAFALATIAVAGAFHGSSRTSPNGDSTASVGAARPMSQTSTSPGESVRLRLEVLADNAIHRPDGTRVVLRLPRRAEATQAAQAAGGWVVAADRDDRSRLYFADRAGATRPVGRTAGSFAVSPDGRILVRTGDLGSPVVEAYELPTLRLLRRTTFGSGMGPQVVGITGDRVLLHGAQGSPAPSVAGIWNLRTGALRRTSADVDVWGSLSGGTVLRRTGTTDTSGRTACLDVVPVADRLPVGRTGLCHRNVDELEASGSLSPDGRWVLWMHYAEDSDEAGAALLRTDDVRAGRWRPQRSPLGGDAHILFWETADTFVVTVDDDQAPYQRCHVSAGCERIVMPPSVAEGATPVTPLAAGEDRDRG